MSGGDEGRKKPPGRRPLMSAEDQALWEFVARRVEPTRGKSRVRDVEPDPVAIERSALRPSPASPPAAAKSGARPPAQRAVSPRPTPAPPPPPKPVTLERRKLRRIAKGTEEIEARLDLHGMTQHDAHHALLGFVRRCHANGFRTVLVITGKGGSRGSRDEGDDVVPRPRGVLRANVPRWLASAELSTLIISYTTAHIRHGGEGALYVRLRRKA